MEANTPRGIPRVSRAGANPYSQPSKQSITLKTSERHYVLKALAVIALVLAGWGASEGPRSAWYPQYADEAWQVECHEDMSCWDCRTMGNRICGPLHGRGNV